MIIRAETLLQFLDLIEGLVERGLGFEADAHRLTITLTGAF